MIEIRLLEDPKDAEAVLRELRASLDDAAFEARARAAQNGGYKVAAAYEEGALRGAMGWRLVEDLCWGRSLFIDDLVVTEDQRGGGVGARLMDWAKAEARRAGCDHVRLCSGLWREPAHRFYRAQGFNDASLQFVWRASQEE